MENRWLIVGLGNPGRSYDCNRHNIGFMFVDTVAEHTHAGAFTFQKALNAKKLTANFAGERLLLVKPETFMNLSGHSVAAAQSYFKILSERTVICYDDVDIPFGAFRIRTKGSSGGHRGLASIIEHVGARFIRVRFGIRPDEGRASRNLAGFVLSDFRGEEAERLGEVFDEALAALRLVVSGRVDEAMNRYNRRQTPASETDDTDEH